MYHENDAWRQAMMADGGIEGIHAKCAKGKWTLDDEPVATGDDGPRLAVIMPQMMHGSVCWAGGQIAERRDFRRYQDAPPDASIPDGFNPYTSFVFVCMDESRAGQLGTFTSSSWSARRAVAGLIGPYLRKGCRELPIVTLGVRPRKNDPNGNIDPTFAIVAWAPVSDFPDLVDAAPAAALIEALDARHADAVVSLPKRNEPAPASGSPIDDDIPF
jgi:hypothetical protein